MRLFLAFTLLLFSGTPAVAGLLDQLNLGEQGKPPLLRPEEAFVFNAEVKNGNILMAQVAITEGYYLYRDKFAFQILNAPDVRVTETALPPGKPKNDPFFGRMEVYEGEVKVQIPIKLSRQATGAETVILKASFQGCSSIHGICYPPVTQKISLKLPPPGGGQASPVATEANPVSGEKATVPLTPQDKIVQTLFSEHIGLTLITFFGFGVLLAFTPCVFPMIPILSGLIVGQGKEITLQRSFMLSFMYVLAMALAYTVAGVIAGLVGQNLQAVFQQPAILIGASLIFVLLALSMFDLYHLQLPASLQTRLSALSQNQKGGTLTGAALMGFFSALIIGPCVAPPLAGALIYIGKSGDAVLGGSALFALSMGMGTPLLVLGTSAGKLLPRAGGWMESVKHFFGVLLLAVAIWLLSRILPQSVTLLLWSALFIIGAVYLGALENLGPKATGWRKLWKGSGLISLVYGILLIIGAASGGGTVWRPLQELNVAESVPVGTPTNAEGLDFRPVKGLEGLQVALQQAGDQLVMLEFYADWCVDCKRMEATTYTAPAVERALRNVVLLQADVTAYDKQDKALLQQFSLYGPPTVLFFGPKGKELERARLIGMASPEEFLKHLQRVQDLLTQNLANRTST